MASIAHMAGESTGGASGSGETNGFRPTTPKAFDTTVVTASDTSPGTAGCVSGSFTISCTESTIVVAMVATGDGFAVGGGFADGGFGAVGRATATFADSATAGCSGGSASVAGGLGFRGLVGCADLAGFADLVARTSISTAETIPGSTTDVSGVSGSLTCGFRSETVSGSATDGSGADGSDGSGADGSGADVLAGVSGFESFA